MRAVKPKKQSRPLAAGLPSSQSAVFEPVFAATSSSRSALFSPQLSGNTPITSQPSQSVSVAPLPVVDGSNSAMQVFVRVRPFSDRERQVAAESGGASALTPVIRIDSQDPTQITILDHRQDFRPKETYCFERCFWSVPNVPLEGMVTERKAHLSGGSSLCLETPPFATQQDVYEFVGKTVLQNAVNGYNGCVFAYGQTGSGKTFTMMGYDFQIAATPAVPNRSIVSTICSAFGPSTPSSMTSSSTSSRRSSICGGPVSHLIPNGTPPPTDLPSSMLQASWEENRGIIPRLTSELFTALAARRTHDSSHSFRVELQFYEIYNEKVFDLLEPQNEKDLRVRQDPVKGPFVEHLTTTTVESGETIERLIRKGSNERHTAATKMNDRSSRSHAIVTLNIIQIVLDALDCPQKTTSKVNLVDLAGSERTGLTGVEGQRFTEATKINLSLTTLGRVIDCLADHSTGKSGGFVHCPYRESNLTWLLMDSLGGNSKTTMIATISPSSMNIEEVTQTVRYASRARQIVNKVVVNEDPQARRLKELQAEIDRLLRVISEANFCSVTNEYVEDLEASKRALEGELADVKSSNAALRCEVEALNAKLARVSDGSTTFRRQQSAVEATTSRAAKAVGRPLAPTPQQPATPPKPSASTNVSAVDASPPFRRMERDVSYLREPSSEDNAQRVTDLTARIHALIEERAVILGKFNDARSKSERLATSSEEAKKVSGMLLNRIEMEEEMMAEHVQLIERLSLRNEEQQKVISGLERALIQPFESSVTAVRDSLVGWEIAHRDIVAAAASQARTDIRTLIIQQNSATERVYESRIKDKLDRKHAASVRALEEEHMRAVDSLKEGFAKQLIQERDKVKELMKKNAATKPQVPDNKPAAISDGKTEQDLQDRLHALQERTNKQISNMQAMHDREKQKLRETHDAEKTRLAETMRVAVADAVAKGKAALDEAKKSRDAAIVQLKDEKEALQRRLAESESTLGEMKNYVEEQKVRLVRREEQLHDWQASLQAAQALELKTLKVEVDEARTAASSEATQRATSHDRHASEVETLRQTAGEDVEVLRIRMDQFEQTATARVAASESRLQELSRTVEVLRNSSAAASETLETETMWAERVKDLAKAIASKDSIIKQQDKEYSHMRDTLMEQLEQSDTLLRRARCDSHHLVDFMASWYEGLMESTVTNLCGVKTMLLDTPPTVISTSFKSDQKPSGVDEKAPTPTSADILDVMYSEESHRGELVASYFENFSKIVVAFGAREACAKALRQMISLHEERLSRLSHSWREEHDEFAGVAREYFHSLHVEAQRRDKSFHVWKERVEAHWVQVDVIVCDALAAHEREMTATLAAEVEIVKQTRVHIEAAQRDCREAIALELIAAKEAFAASTTAWRETFVSSLRCINDEHNRHAIALLVEAEMDARNEIEGAHDTSCESLSHRTLLSIEHIQRAQAARMIEEHVLKGEALRWRLDSALIGTMKVHIGDLNRSQRMLQCSLEELERSLDDAQREAEERHIQYNHVVEDLNLERARSDALREEQAKGADLRVQALQNERDTLRQTVVHLQGDIVDLTSLLVERRSSEQKTPFPMARQGPQPTPQQQQRSSSGGLLSYLKFPFGFGGSRASVNNGGSFTPQRHDQTAPPKHFFTPMPSTNLDSASRSAPFGGGTNLFGTTPARHTASDAHLRKSQYYTFAGEGDVVPE